MLKQTEFKTQFQPALIKSGSLRVNLGYGRKHYIARFVQSGVVIHDSRKQFRRASEATEYANTVLARYRVSMQAAFMTFVEAQNVSAD